MLGQLVFELEITSTNSFCCIYHLIFNIFYDFVFADIFKHFRIYQLSKKFIILGFLSRNLWRLNDFYSLNWHSSRFYKFFWWIAIFYWNVSISSYSQRIRARQQIHWADQLLQFGYLFKQTMEIVMLILPDLRCFPSFL